MELINPNSWLQKISRDLHPTDHEVIKQAVSLAQLVNEGKPIVGESRLNQSLTTADILHQLHLDSTTLSAAILHKNLHQTSLTIEDVTDHLGEQVANLVHGVEQMAGISEFYQGIQGRADHFHNVDNIRKMFLAMVDDIRVVLIKLAEQLAILRHAINLPEKAKKQLAAETMAIYAPLSNRLGIAQIKWELEDLAFKYLEPEKYLEIANSLEHYFPESSKYIEEVTASLQDMLHKTNIKNIQVTGRAKHIYSIYRKMNRKKTNLEGIYDVSALRVFVPSVTDCYEVLSLVHNTWQYIPHEFDDYIAAPKTNGYSSIHTAVYGPNNRVIEIQIRTHDMHQKAELGVAAHWVYKEGKQETNYQTKLAWLRQVMDWQHEISAEKSHVNLKQIFNDYIYVFTTKGDILELPQGSTPIDFAYHIHSEIGHSCTGAKIENKMVPLTYKLKTGDHVKILTAKKSTPSRDWLIMELGFLRTSKAKSKVLHWFKKQSREHHIEQGQALINKEIKRLHIKKLDLKSAADKLHFKSPDDLTASLGSGDLKFNNILHALHIETKKAHEEITLTPSTHNQNTPEIYIEGADNLLIHTSTCCKPIPGEEIIGYITQGKGIAVHRADCTNAINILKTHPERFIAATWGSKSKKKYPTNITVKAFSRKGLVRDITHILSEEKILVTELNHYDDKKDNTTRIKMAIEIIDLNTLSQILNKINRLPNIIEIYRRD